MCVTLTAEDFGSDHAVTDVSRFFNGLRVGSLKITRPAASCIELMFGAKEWGTTAYAYVLALGPMVPVFAAKGRLSMLFSRHRVLHVSERFTVLRIWFFERGIHGASLCLVGYRDGMKTINSPLSSSETPFLSHLEPQAAWAEAGRSRLELILKPWQLNGFGVAHGGVVMTLLDAVMAMAAKSADPAAAWVVTIEMKTSFLRPAKGHLIALGWCDHRTTTLSFCRAEIQDTSERLLAQGMGTFRRRS